ncbi:hypothetical protein ACFT16_44370, partial [Streptomyces sp. NPDC056983]
MITARGQDAGQQPVSAAPRQRMGDYQTMAVNTRNRIHAVLPAAGLEPDEADELVCAREAGAVARAHCWVEELGRLRSRRPGAECAEGWDGGVDRAL